MDKDETIEDLVEATERLVHPPSRRQIERWQKAELIPSGRQCSRGRGRGTYTIYPPGTALQLRAVSEIRDQHRDLDAVAWELWLAGYQISLARVRRSLKTTAQSRDSLAKVLRAAGFARTVLPQGAFRLIERLARRRLSAAGAPDIRARVGSVGRRETLVRVALQVALGTYEPHLVRPPLHADDDEGLLVEAAIGLGPAREDRVLAVGPWLKGDASEDLRQVARLIGGSWHRTLEAATDEDLLQARLDWLRLRETLIGVGDAIRQSYGGNAFGLPAIGDLLRAAGPLESSCFVFMLLALQQSPDPTLRASVVRLEDFASAWREAAPKFAALQQLRDEVPALQDALAPERVCEAMRDQISFDRFLEELRLRAEAARPQIERALGV